MYAPELGEGWYKPSLNPCYNGIVMYTKYTLSKDEVVGLNPCYNGIVMYLVAKSLDKVITES